MKRNRHTQTMEKKQYRKRQKIKPSTNQQKIPNLIYLSFGPIFRGMQQTAKNTQYRMNSSLHINQHCTQNYADILSSLNITVH